MIRLNVSLSDELNDEIDQAVKESESTKSELMRKALQLYLAALDGKKKGLKLGLAKADSKEIETEIIGL